MSCSKKTTFFLILASAVLLGIIGFFLKPIPQPPAYNHFADQRSWSKVPNAWNVLSNIPVALAGIWGLLLLAGSKVQFIFFDFAIIRLFLFFLYSI